MTTDDDGFAAWLRANPVPDLQELLVRKHGGYDRITPEAWADYDRAIVDWQARRRSRSEGGRAEERDPECICLCGLPGIVSRPRKGGGRPIWQCSQHSSCWPDYVEESSADDQPEAASVP